MSAGPVEIRRLLEGEPCAGCGGPTDRTSFCCPGVTYADSSEDVSAAHMLCVECVRQMSQSEAANQAVMERVVFHLDWKGRA